MSEISLIAALDRNFAIGRDGAMPWHLPDDLKRFKALTLGKPVLMGRKTALAIGRALPGARESRHDARRSRAPFPASAIVHSLDEAIARRRRRRARRDRRRRGFALALPRATRMHLTWVDTEVAGRRRVLSALRCARVEGNRARRARGRCAPRSRVHVRGLRAR